MADHTLIASLKNNDPQAMDTLFDQYWEQVFDAAFKRTSNEEVAQDITQEIFISLWENRESLILEGSLAGYLYGAVKFKVINYFRAQATRAGHHEELTFLMEQQQVQQSDTKLMLNELNQEVDAAFATLPARMQLVMAMSRKQDKSIKEIAAELGVSAQTVKNQISAALKILRKNLSYILILAFLLLTKS